MVTTEKVVMAAIRKMAMADSRRVPTKLTNAGLVIERQVLTAMNPMMFMSQ